MDSSDKYELRLAGIRFAWATLLLYAGLTVGLWAAHLAFPQSMGAVNNYTVEVSLIGAVAFGGLYAAAMTLHPTRPTRPQTADHP